MSAFELSPGDVRYLKFDDAITKYNQPTIKEYNAKKNQHLLLSEFIYNKITKHKNVLIKDEILFIAFK